MRESIDMGYTTWIFLSEILAVVMLWVFILEFTNNFNEQDELERLASERMVRRYDLKCQPKVK